MTQTIDRQSLENITVGSEVVTRSGNRWEIETVSKITPKFICTDRGFCGTQQYSREDGKHRYQKRSYLYPLTEETRSKVEETKAADLRQRNLWKYQKAVRCLETLEYKAAKEAAKPDTGVQVEDNSCGFYRRMDYRINGVEVLSVTQWRKDETLSTHSIEYWGKVELQFKVGSLFGKEADLFEAEVLGAANTLRKLWESETAADREDKLAQIRTDAEAVVAQFAAEFQNEVF